MTRKSSVPRRGMPVYRTDGRAIGHYQTDAEGREWLTKFVKPEHQLYAPPARCTDAGHLAQLRETSRVRSWQKRSERRGCCPWWSGKRVRSNIRLPGRSFAKPGRCAPASPAPPP